MNRFVIDASVVVKLFFEEEHSSDSETLVANALDMLAPDFLFLEVANVFWKRLRRNDLKVEDVLASLHDALGLKIAAHKTTDLVLPAFEIAAETGRTVYDCTYLALALREQCHLVTADERFVNALKSSRFAPHIRLVSTLSA